ncbi:PD-(D/E)XK nuclease family protein [Natronorubrum texcoconense]|uniref:PD-(D/E)XK nuclease superfamily protein n=1 Tax=Natronorubrum texcoconense TaxID=1095776 RepID=A0A1G9D5R7_9EURY|nr:PD-(D/E)XK nuclease family protein [Natronorubrum texcoconense]SDK59064.1 PD-(D/E)XK nuclease superfamily protein [Natronorubrum texcoconense]
MSLKQSKPIDRLYHEVANYDLVIVPDSPLADALNRRLERPHFGPFAITPRRLATRRRETAEDRTAFLEVIDETDLSWKEIAYTVGNVLQCWEYRGRADAIFEYGAFDTPATRTVVDIVSSLQTSSRLLADYEIDVDSGESVAVVGESQLTNLERSILPDEYDSIDRFTADAFDLPAFRIFESPAAIVDAILDTVTQDNADEIAIVLDSSSEYSPLIESALETAAIPYYGGPGFMDDRDHRAFVQLLRCTTAGSDTRVHSVKPLLSCLGATVPIEHDGKRLTDVDDSEIGWLREFIGRADALTFEATLNAYEDRAGRTLETFREELARLGVLEEPITTDAIDRLAFYLETYEVPIDRDNEGVLLADAKSASFVDRPVVCYLGLDEDWTHDSPNRPWVDRNEEYERNVDGFQSLLQSGVEQQYLVQDAAGGTAVTPCLYFDELLETEFERFSDLESIHHSRSDRSTGDGFDREPLDAPVDPERVETVSQSSLNTYANSPRDYCFGRLVDTPDKHYFVDGNLFHDFAEFVVNHPEFVDDGRLEDAAAVMVEETRAFHRRIDLETQRTRYRIGLETICDYLEEHAPTETTFLTPSSGWGENFFAEYFDRDVDSPVTERWFEDDDLRLKGKIDLVQSPTRLVDFKSGNRTSATQVTKHGSIDEPSDEPNFQALCYLSYWRRQQPDESLEFTFFHFLETLDDVVAGDATLEDCLTTLTYRPIAFDEFVQTRTVFDELREDAANDCNKTFSKADYETYLAVLDAYDVPRTRDADEMADSPFGEALVERLVDDVGDYKYVRNGCVQAFRHLCGYRKEGYFVEDLDAFERFVDEQLEELNRYRRGEDRFPIDGRAGEPNYRYVDTRDMLLTDSRATRGTAQNTHTEGAPAADPADSEGHR